MIRPVASRLKARFVGAHVPVTPRELRAIQAGPCVLSNSIPKAGTHLTERVFELSPLMVPRWKKDLPFSSADHLESYLGCTKGQYICGHLYWTEDLSKFLSKNDIKVVFTVRDIRDVAVSRAHYHTNMLTTHKSYKHFQALDSDEDRLSLSIAGNMDWHLHGLHAMYEGYIPWLNDPNCIVVRFEDLVGPAGGGSQEKQYETTRDILRFIGADVNDAILKDMVGKLHSSNAKTFRRGVVGSWREEFSDLHKQEFKQEANDFLVALGYEANDCW